VQFTVQEIKSEFTKNSIGVKKPSSVIRKIHGANRRMARRSMYSCRGHGLSQALKNDGVVREIPKVYAQGYWFMDIGGH